MVAWIEENVITAKRLEREGKSYKEIAEHFDCTDVAVSAMFYRLRLGKPVGPNRDWTPEELDELDELEASGMPWAEMASRLHRAERTLKVKIKELRGADYVRPKAWGNYVPREISEIAPRRNDDVAHCLSILRSSDPSSPKGCGYPVCDAPALVRIAA